MVMRAAYARLAAACSWMASGPSHRAANAGRSQDALGLAPPSDARSFALRSRPVAVDSIAQDAICVAARDAHASHASLQAVEEKRRRAASFLFGALLHFDAGQLRCTSDGREGVPCGSAFGPTGRAGLVGGGELHEHRSGGWLSPVWGDIGGSSLAACDVGLSPAGSASPTQCCLWLVQCIS